MILTWVAILLQEQAQEKDSETIRKRSPHVEYCASRTALLHAEEGENEDS